MDSIALHWYVCVLLLYWSVVVIFVLVAIDSSHFELLRLYYDTAVGYFDFGFDLLLAILI